MGTGYQFRVTNTSICSVVYAKKCPRKASYKYYILRSLKHGTETSKNCDQSIRQISTKAK